MSSAETRLKMARAIVNFEARRDSKGRLAVYSLHPADGGGTYEVAGINDRYHPAMASKLRALIYAGKQEEAETEVAKYLLAYTDVVADWDIDVPGIEFFLRDSVFNRGPTGAAKIMQMALSVDVDGIVGEETEAALYVALDDAPTFLKKLRAAREKYERVYAGRNEGSMFWDGLVNRWNKAVTTAKTFSMESDSGAKTPAVPPAGTSWISTIIGALLRIFFPRPAPPLKLPPVNKTDDPVDAKPPLITGDRGYTDEDLRSPDFPAKPSFQPLLSTAARQRVFGEFRYRSAPTGGNPEAIQILDNWAADSIIRVPLPQMRKTKIVNAPEYMHFHKLAAKQLQGMWADWEAAGLLHLILTFEGSFVPRYIRGSRSTLSNHAFGTAFDINYSWNMLGHTPMGVGKKGSVRALVPIAHRWGFYWGGHFGSRPDGMHFEVARVL